MFVTERKGPLSNSAFSKILVRAGEVARLGFPVHPHMLRHSTGFKLANDGQDTRAIQHIVRYTELSSERFKGTSGTISELPDGSRPLQNVP